ncbi:MAG: ABC transporter ATP-binding protein [Sphingomonadales bacterium]|nr:ABC transporter ATP-binding protein [Sphingomonadales bacterium]NCP26022.1 ABC transporter ATP-binding protein [Sphingomonadales bacterium]NCP48618.1 ABC transporter ATP-binding protein [Sphingomonadales bacterium]
MPELFNPRRLWLLAALITNGFFQVGALAAVAFLIREIMNASNDTAALSVPWASGGLIAANLALGFLKWHELVASQRLGEDYSMDMRRAAFHHLGRLSLHAQTKLRGGSLQLRFVNDLTAIRNWISQGLARLILSTIIALGAVAALWVIEPAMGLVLSGIVVLAMLGALAIGGMFDHSIRKARKRRGQIAANISEKIANTPVIQAFAHVDIERQKLKKQSRRLADAQVEKAAVTGIFRGYMIFVVGSGIAGLVAAANWSAGPAGPDTAALVSAIGLFSLLSPNLFRLGRVYEFWKTARIAREKLARLFEFGPTIIPAAEPRKPRKRFSGLKVENVSLGSVLCSINCSIEATDRIVLKGENGAGKTTLLNTMLRLVEPEKGRVRLSGTDIRTISTGSLRRQISIISPSLGVMKGTIASNIAYGSKKADESDVAWAAERCAMDAGNPKSPFQLERKVHEGGRNLSAGERMRIIIARAIVSRPNLLLLDEPETHLDPASLQVLLTLLGEFEGAWLATSHGEVLDHLATHHWSMTNGRLDIGKEVLAA